MAERGALATLRTEARPVYLPWVCCTFTMGILIPVLPFHLSNQGVGIAATSLVLGAAGGGAIGGAVLAGALTHRLGQGRVAVVSLLLMGAAVASMGFTGSVGLLVGLQLLVGVAAIGVMLSRHTHLTSSVAIGLRGRAMALMGGSMRFSFLVGPAVGGVLVDLVGFRSTFLVAGAAAALGCLGMLPELRTPPSTTTEVARGSGFGALMRRHRGAVARCGTAGFLIMAAREGRMVALPLVGISLGLSPSSVGGLVAVGTGADLLLFPFAGWIMDRYGRLWAMVPAYSLLGLGLGLLALAEGPGLAVTAGAVMGIGNGLSSGSLFTMGSDMAPDDATAPFLGVITVMSDAGRIAGPILVGVVAQAAGLGWASWAVAGVAALAVLWLLAVVGETGGRGGSGPPVGTTSVDAGEDARPFENP